MLAFLIPEWVCSFLNNIHMFSHSSLLSWKSICYKRLASDLDWRVRAAAHRSLGLWIRTAGRKGAPYLRLVMGPWWRGQNEVADDVSSAAVRAFELVFSTPQKRSGALVYCRDSLLEFLRDCSAETPATIRFVERMCVCVCAFLDETGFS